MKFYQPVSRSIIKNIFPKKIVRDSALFTCAGYLNHLLSFIRGFVVAKVLGPTLYGYLTGTRLVLMITGQSSFGALHGMTKLFSLSRLFHLQWRFSFFCSLNDHKGYRHLPVDLPGIVQPVLQEYQNLYP